MADLDSSDTGAIQNSNNKSPNPLGGLHGFKKRLRSLDIEIVNKTGHVLRFLDEDFRSGTWYISPHPVNIKPGESCFGYACSRFISIVGVHGAMMYELVGTGIYLYIGFDNQVIGPLKIFIELNSSFKTARWASDQVQTEAMKNISYDGYDAYAVIKPPRLSPFRMMQFTVEERAKMKNIHIQAERITDDECEQ